MRRWEPRNRTAARGPPHAADRSLHRSPHRPRQARTAADRARARSAHGESWYRGRRHPVRGIAKQQQPSRGHKAPEGDRQWPANHEKAMMTRRTISRAHEAPAQDNPRPPQRGELSGIASPRLPRSRPSWSRLTDRRIIRRGPTLSAKARGSRGMRCVGVSRQIDGDTLRSTIEIKTAVGTLPR